MAFAVYESTCHFNISHSGHHRVAVFSERTEAERFSRMSNTCSICRPELRTMRRATGVHAHGFFGLCYRIFEEAVPVTDRDANAAVLRLVGFRKRGNQEQTGARRRR